MTVSEQISELNEKLDLTREQISADRAVLSRVSQQLDKISDSILGNGKPGLTSKVEQVKLQVKIIWGVLAAVGTACLAVVVSIISKAF